MTKQKNIFVLLKKDHQAVARLFSMVEKAPDKATGKKLTLYAKIREELTRHAHGEEKAIYPLLKEIEKTEDIAYESVEEHAVVKYLLAKIDGLSVEMPEWMACVTVLKEVVEHHVEEEEDEMFGKMRKAFSKDELGQIAANFTKAKKTAPLQALKFHPQEHRQSAEQAA